MTPPNLKQTAFYPFHLGRGGKMVDFAGWAMPVQYTSITQEHLAVRSAAGLFDISHMGQTLVWGREAEDFLQRIVSNDLRNAGIGKGIYAHLLNENGGVVDDIFVYRLEEDKFLAVLNASRVEVDLAWIDKHRTGFECEVMEAPYASALALQGPRAAEILDKLAPGVANLGRHAIGDFNFGDVSALVARTGYTGEDGFEIFGPAGHLLLLWPHIFEAGREAGLLPCGLGARDTLRTEVAYPLYGHELDETHTPLQAGLGWVVKLEKGEFIGRGALLKQNEAGLPTKLTGFKVETGGVARPGGTIHLNNKEIGTVTSGTFAPSLGFAIGLAYLPPEATSPGTPLIIQQGARRMEAAVVKTPFYSKS